MIFLSHSWTNKPIARQLVEALAREHLPAWLDEQQLDAGAGLRAGLLDAIAKSDAYLYLVSKDANSSKWVHDELQFAIGLEFEKKLKAVPVRLVGDDTSLPPLLSGRVYHTLDVEKGGGAARLAHLLKDVASPEVPSGCRVSATVRLESTGLVHTLDEARRAPEPDAVDALYLNDAYERIDSLYWSVSEVKLAKDAKGTSKELEYAARVLADMHARARSSITELKGLTVRYLGVAPGRTNRLYFEAGYLQAMRVILHHLSWLCEYLLAFGEGRVTDEVFVARAHLPEPFDGHVCDFGDGTTWLGGVRVPPHGHPFGPDRRPIAWGLSSPFSDMVEDEVGKAVGHVVAKRFLARTLPSTEMLDPEKLQYGLG